MTGMYRLHASAVSIIPVITNCNLRCVNFKQHSCDALRDHYHESDWRVPKIIDVVNRLVSWNAVTRYPATMTWIEFERRVNDVSHFWFTAMRHGEHEISYCWPIADYCSTSLKWPLALQVANKRTRKMT